MRVEPPLRHGRSIEIYDVAERLGKSCGDVAEADQVVIYIFDIFAVCEKPSCSISNTLQVERGFRCGIYELIHQLNGFLFASEHGLECDFELLKLASDIDDLADKRLSGKSHADTCGGFRHIPQSAIQNIACIGNIFKGRFCRNA